MKLLARVSTSIAALVVLAPATALAHPGHGHTAPDSWLHYLTEPVHAIAAAVALGAGIALTVGSWRRSRATRR